jgi:hypothetical protein
MASTPSIKGSIFGRAVEDLHKLVEAGEISRTELERRLEPADLPVLEESIWAGSWYDVQTYGRLLELRKEVEGKGRNEYLSERGKQSAEVLLEKGLYQQLDYLDRTQVAAAREPEERYLAFGRDLKLLVSLHHAIMNFGRQEVRPDPDHDDRYMIELHEADSCPDALCWTTTGFMNRMSRQHSQGDLWTWKRMRPNLVVFRMTRAA